ncbi:MAG TPA: hypothetical protein VG101_02870 [Puia sp.]|jgi:hypothetical protein|nr:hypothetical protein [Puia sp.]
MNKYLLLIILSMLAASCKSKKVSLAGNDDGELSVSEFIDYFQPLALPYAVSDTILRRREPEAASINYKLFTRLVPDSLLTRYFGATARPRLYAVGKIKVPKAETYVFVKCVTSGRRMLYVLCFDRKDLYSAARPVLYSESSPGVWGAVGMDGKYTLSLTHYRKAADGEVYHTTDDYIYNEAGSFDLILTESNENKNRVLPLYNPIDTLPRKHRFSGDYAQDKRNIVSIRDSREAGRFHFFVHFEKDNGECKGELKGEAKFVSPGVARYRAYSDPCAVEFTFDGGGVSMKELGGCGVHRDIKCFFEGYFQRRRDTHPKPAAKRA